MRRWKPIAAVLAASAVAALAAAVTERASPPPAAIVARGTEAVFASGLEPRELPPGHGILRWTTGHARFRFLNLPAGPTQVEVRVHGQKAPVTVSAQGVLLGVLEPGETSARFPGPPPRDGGLEVVLDVPTFVAGDGRHLGALLDEVRLRPSAGAGLPLRLLVLFLVPALAVVGGAFVAGVGPASAAGLASVTSAAQALLLWPGGAAHSVYAFTLMVLLVVGAAAAAGLGWIAGRCFQGGGRAAFVAVLAAWLVQGAAATSPLMVVSDAVFHANKLAAVAGGDLFPTSVTQHAHPFRFPYGVSFYALLAPLARAGLDRVVLVRWGAAGAGLLGSLAAFWLLAARGPWLGALAVVVLQFLPATFLVYSYGNLSNVLGQSLTLVFLAWWAGRARGGPLTGALLLALAGLAHFSSLVVLGALLAGLVLLERTEVRRDRTRLIALGLGCAVLLAYYAHFSRLVVSELPRLLEGGGGSQAGATAGIGAALVSQLRSLLAEWGLPAILLGLLGLPWASPGRPESSLRAFWVAGAALAALAVVSPLEVRYGYALTLPLAAAVAEGARWLWARGRLGTLGAVLLLVGQAAIGVAGIVEAVAFRYRP